MSQIFHLQEVIRGALECYLMVRIILTAQSMSKELLGKALKNQKRFENAFLLHLVEALYFFSFPKACF